MTMASDNCSASSAAERTTIRPARSSPSALSILPGVALAGGIATVAFLLRHIHGMAAFSPMILAIIIGMAFHNIVGTPSLARPGIMFSLRRLLRAAIVLLGFQLTVTQIASVGPRGLFIVAISLMATFAFTVWAGRVLGVGRKLTELIAAGTSICGASAIIATNTITKPTTRMSLTLSPASRSLAQSRCLPIRSCPACCTLIPRLTASGAGHRSTRSHRLWRPLSRMVNAPVKLPRWSN